MRNMRRAAMQRGVIAILDVGTSKIACLILRFDGPDRLREQDGVRPMAGQSQFRVIAQRLGRGQITVSLDGDGDLAEFGLDALDLLAKGCFDGRLEGVEFGTHCLENPQRAIVFSRRILACNCRMP